MLRNLAADAVVAEAVLYAAGARRLTVEHVQPLTEQADSSYRPTARGRRRLGGGGRRLPRWRHRDRPVDVDHLDLFVHRRARRQLVGAARLAADRLSPGEWIITCDDHE